MCNQLTIECKISFVRYLFHNQTVKFMKYNKITYEHKAKWLLERLNKLNRI